MDMLLEQTLRKILEEHTYVDENSHCQYGYEIYLDYDEEIDDRSLAIISDSDDPLGALYEVEMDWIINAEDYYYPELIKTIRENMDEEVFEENEDDIREWVDENVYWYLPKKWYKQEVDAVISLDTGDMNYDFTCCNILNWYGSHNIDNTLDNNSPIKWLAKQQGKLTELNEALKVEGLDQSTDFQTQEYEYSRFTKTTIQELQNACSHMNTLIFLCKMPLMDFVNLKDMIKSEKKLNDSYEYEKRKGVKTFTISKDAMCGLYDIWGGGGSVLEIELEKDVVVPTKAVFDVWIDCRGCGANGRGYDVSDVYGMGSNAWTGSVTLNSAA